MKILGLILVLIRLHCIIHGQVDIILQDYSFEESNRMMADDPGKFREAV